MRQALAVLAALLAFAAAPPAVTGWWADQAAFERTDAFEQRMQSALQDGAIRAELLGQAQAGASNAIMERFGVSGPGQNWLADLAVRLVRDRVLQSLESEQFADGRRRSHRQLHTDPTAFARSRPTESVTVAGPIISMDIAPLVTAFDLPAGLRITQQFDTGGDVAGQLRGLGWLQRHRWPVLAGLVAVLGMALLSGGSRGLGRALLTAGTGCLAAAAWLALVPPADPSALGNAVRGALLAGWGPWLPTASAALSATAALLLIRRPARAWGDA